MAARIHRTPTLTLVFYKTPLFGQDHSRLTAFAQRSAGSWTVQSKSKREKILYEAPKFVPVDKTVKKSEIQNIVIPQKVKRKPTAILEALASTVRNDINQPIYSTIDDPFLYSTTDRAKKSHLAAYESGRKTAEHMLSLYPDYFTPIWEDPLPNEQSDISSFINAPDYKTFSPFPPNTWKGDNAAEEVFEALPRKTATAYSQMVRGMAAVSISNFGFILLDVETYNAILKVASLDTETMDDVKLFIETILKDMAENKVAPNERTFVSAMINCRRLSRWSGSKKFVLALFSEMKACGIEPGLSTYVEILHIFYYFKDKTAKTTEMFEQVLDDLKGKEFECKTENDVQFFRSVMGMIAAHFPDSKLALRVHEMLQYGKNRELLSNRQAQYGYYSDLLSVIIPLESIDVVMNLYREIVPYIFFPPSSTYKLIFESIEMHESHHYLPELYAAQLDSFCGHLTYVISHNSLEN
ncbi:pentatricopeptide repeat domain-containing protein 3, mitochondrial [Elysia marginata]|uniref:Pentatricopeptide repeat domain-containing protein 3, mitochondrial n=1 Tax=Elysia marginata TaxID=1093978 RepID=A0AAV4FF91_9GAST|nr:pentatricopeptide repeat domain-containing protein 3, mitochondrial [Elysia marginata]